MKTVGLIGGMSWESTITYYQILNRLVKQQFGDLHSAKIVLISVDFAEIEACQRNDQWQRAGEILSDAAKRLESAGADCILLCTNTMHKVSSQITSATKLPFLHIADALIEEIRARRFTKIGLLGTTYTMSGGFYIEMLQKAGIEVLVPGLSDQALINAIIFDELCQGKIKQSSREIYEGVIHKLVEEGAQAIVLGCTEIGLLLTEATLFEVPLLDTTLLHARKAFAFLCS